MEEVYAGKKSLKERVRVCQRKEKERVEREESGEKWLIGERAKHFARPSVLFLASCFLLLASMSSKDSTSTSTSTSTSISSSGGDGQWKEVGRRKPGLKKQKGQLVNWVYLFWLVLIHL